jgi:hypothetical protein
MLPADEGESGTQFGQGVLQPVGESLFQGLLGGAFGEVQEVEDVRVPHDFPGLIRLGRVQVLIEVTGRGPDPPM